MSLVTGAAIYFIIWWMTLFLVLPFGVRRDNQIEEGNDPGAPAMSRMWVKVAVNTGVALVVWAIVYAIIEFDLITLDDLGISR
jgi:predicted secreted protein